MGLTKAVEVTYDIQAMVVLLMDALSNYLPDGLKNEDGSEFDLNSISCKDLTTWIERNYYNSDEVD
jgi:hypothetical protein